MNNTTLKFRLIFLPFLITSICFLTGYSFLNWLLITQLQLPLDEELVQIWLPIVVSLIITFFVIRPRIKFLVLPNKGRNDVPGLYFFVALFGLVGPVIVAQTYLETAAGKLTNLNKVTEISTKPVTQFYKIKSYVIDKRHIAFRPAVTTSGKNNEHMNFNIYVVCPILKDSAGLNQSARPDAWLGLVYSESISNNLSSEDKERNYQTFLKESNKQFINDNLNNYDYFQKPAHNDHSKHFTKALQQLPRFKDAEVLVLEGKYGKFEDRNGNTLMWIFISLGIAQVVWLVMVLIPKLNKRALNKSQQNRISPKQPQFKLLSVFNPANSFFVSAIIIAINVLVFVAMVFAGLGVISFEGPDLYDWGANSRASVMDGQWWRLITNTFVHGGLMHILGNMYGLFFAAIALEPLLGKWKYALAYFVTGLIASVSSIWWQPAGTSVGASGAIFGLYGVLLVMLLANRIDKDAKKFFLINCLIFVGFNLLMGIRGNVDNAAHLGGLASGVIIGLVYLFIIPVHAPPKRPNNRSINEHMPEVEHPVDP